MSEKEKAISADILGALVVGIGYVHTLEAPTACEGFNQMRDMADAQSMAERISLMTLTFTARAGEGTKLYGSITSANIADKISEELGREFDRRKLHLEESLRQLGTHQVPVRLMADVETELTVVIEREDGEPEETE